VGRWEEQNIEVRGQESEDRGRRAEANGIGNSECGKLKQRSEDGGMKTEGERLRRWEREKELKARG